MNAIVNPHVWSRLSKHAVERTHRNKPPAPAITAPDNHDQDHTEEAVRLAYFDQSRRTRAGRRADYRKPQA